MGMLLHEISLNLGPKCLQYIKGYTSLKLIPTFLSHLITCSIVYSLSLQYDAKLLKLQKQNSKAQSSRSSISSVNHEIFRKVCGVRIVDYRQGIQVSLLFSETATHKGRGWQGEWRFEEAHCRLGAAALTSCQEKAAVAPAPGEWEHHCLC